MGKFYWDPAFTASLSSDEIRALAMHERMHLEVQKGSMSDEEFVSASARIDAFERGESCPDPHPAIKTAGMVFATTTRTYPAGDRTLYNVPGLNPTWGESAAAMEKVMQEFGVNRPDATAHCVDVSVSVSSQQLAWVGNQIRERFQTGDVVLAFRSHALVVDPWGGETWEQAITRIALTSKEVPETDPKSALELARQFTTTRTVVYTNQEVEDDFDEVVKLPKYEARR